MTKFRAGAAVAFAALLASAGARAETFSLNQALGVTYDTNPQLAAQRASLRATDEGVAQANAGWRPSLTAQGEYGEQHYEFSGNGIPSGSTAQTHPLQGQVTLTEPIFRGGRTWAEIGRAKALVRAGRAQLTGTEQTVLLNAVSAYMDMVQNQAIVDLRKHNVDVLEKQLHATQIQFNAGALTRTDVAQSQARLAGAQSDLTVAQGQLQVSRATYEQVIGRPPETLDVDPALPAIPGTEDDAIALAGKQSPAVVAARETERAADYAVDDAVGALMPQLSLQAQYGYQGAVTFGGVLAEPTTTTTSLMAQLNVPIYQGGGDEASVRQAKELHSQAQLNVANADRSARESARAAWESFQSAEGTIASAQSQLTANQLAFEGVSKEQQVGGRTVLDVLNAEQELLNSQVAVVTARHNAEVAAYGLLAATGQLTAKNLDLAVKLYNPKDHYDDDSDAWFGFD